MRTTDFKEQCDAEKARLDAANSGVSGYVNPTNCDPQTTLTGVGVFEPVYTDAKFTYNTADKEW